MTKTKGLFGQINNAVNDLRTADFQTYAYPVKKLARLLRNEELQKFNEVLTDGIDLEGFLEKGMESQSSMIGSAQLDWPESEAEVIGLQYLLIQKFGENPDGMMNFAHTFYYSGNRKMIRDIQNVTIQLIIPFVRDYKSYVESNGATDNKWKLPMSQKIFIVHGHDDAARETVARYIEKLGLETIILHEQANKGRTVIEKVETNSDVGFAVVLLTPDDLGRAKPEKALQPRARQNVLLELGYFMGKLGRDKVCALRRGEVSIPSDFAGIVWADMDDGGGWKTTLARELKAAGHEIDLNLTI